jgi:histidine triad (HIT) family protein
MSSPDCIFCKIASGEVPARIVHRDELATAFRDLNPQAPEHILLIPNRHISSLSDLGEADRGLAGSLLLLAAQIAAQEQLAARGYRVVINTGSGAGQSVFHLHLHLLSGRPMGWPPG